MTLKDKGLNLDRLEKQVGLRGKHPKPKRPPFWDYRPNSGGKPKVGNGYYRRQLRKIRKVVL